MKNTNFWIKFRIISVLLSCVFAFILIYFKAFTLQVIDREKLKARADSQHVKSVPVAAKRGSIYDRAMRELAVSTEVDSVYVQPAKIENVKKSANALAHVLDMDVREVQQKLSSKKPFVWVKRQLDFDEAENIRKLNMPGIGFVKEGKRFYPKPQVASHLIGFVGRDSKGLEGIELGYDRYMAGAAMRLIGERDALGGELLFTNVEKEASKGVNLILTLDKTIQYIAEKELHKAVSTTKAKSGTAIVMSPKTGEILAMANAPHFQPESFYAYDNPSIWRNKAITDAFEPGSTFKAFLLAGVLEEGAAKSSDIFYCEGGSYAVADRVFHDVKKFGWLTLSNVIKYSSNICASKVGDKMGRERFFRYVKDFGFGAKTGIGLPGETSGSVPPMKEWTKVVLGNISFGQGISVTGMQLVNAFAAIANHGNLLKPYVVKKVVNEKGEVIEEARPEVIRKVISEETARKVTNILKEVTKPDGTGARAAVEGFEVAGKTGTAQKPDLVNGGYVKQRYISSFVGFVPADSPELVILVVLDEPSGEFYGGAVAAPAFREIAQQSLAYLGVFPKGYRDKVRPLYVVKQDTTPFIEEKDDSSTMPNLRGMSIRSVLRLAREIPLEVKVLGSGKAVYQKPLPGERITEGTVAQVWFQ